MCLLNSRHMTSKDWIHCWYVLVRVTSILSVHFHFVGWFLIDCLHHSPTHHRCFLVPKTVLDRAPSHSPRLPIWQKYLHKLILIDCCACEWDFWWTYVIGCWLWFNKTRVDRTRLMLLLLDELLKLLSLQFCLLLLKLLLCILDRWLQLIPMTI